MTRRAEDREEIERKIVDLEAAKRRRDVDPLLAWLAVMTGWLE